MTLLEVCESDVASPFPYCVEKAHQFLNHGPAH